MSHHFSAFYIAFHHDCPVFYVTNTASAALLSFSDIRPIPPGRPGIVEGICDHKHRSHVSHDHIHHLHERLIDDLLPAFGNAVHTFVIPQEQTAGRG